ncbi:MAG: hypothetical protein AAFV62_07140, partial [Pseudomonadota bacterium]
FQLLRLLREAVKPLNLANEPVPLTRSLRRMIEGTGEAEDGGKAKQRVAVLFTDVSAGRLPVGTADTLREGFEKAGLSLIAIEIGEGRADPELAALAEATGGQAIPVRDLGAFGGVVERLLSRAHRFCALRVTAPRSFFDAGPMSVTLERPQLSGCRLRQVATLSCEGVSMRQRISTEVLGAEGDSL